jgi:hypothetical protein
MPKAKPDQVVVHRIELQGKERELLEMAVGAHAVGKVALPVVGAGAVAVAGYVGYKAAKAAFGWTEDILDDMREIVKEKVMEPILGADQYTNPKTGQTFKNPLAGWPVLGSLFGSGINLGIASFNKSESNKEKQAEKRANDPRSQEGGHPAYQNYGQPKTYTSREEMYGV